MRKRERDIHVKVLQFLLSIRISYCSQMDQNPNVTVEQKTTITEFQIIK